MATKPSTPLDTISVSRSDAWDLINSLEHQIYQIEGATTVLMQMAQTLPDAFGESEHWTTLDFVRLSLYRLIEGMNESVSGFQKQTFGTAEESAEMQNAVVSVPLDDGARS